MESQSYVRTEMLDQAPPPPSTAGAIGWIRENLFDGWLNTLLTLLSLAFIIWGLVAFLPWLFSPTWTSPSLAACRDILHEAGREHGACWGVINERWRQILYGFYPADLRWRPNFAFALLFIALIPVLFAMISRRMNWVLLFVVLLGGTLAAENSALIWAIRLVLLAGVVAIGFKLFATDAETRAEEIAAGARRLPNPLWFSGLYVFLMPWLLWGGPVWTPLLVIVGFVVGYLAYRIVTAVAGSLAGSIAGTAAALLWWLVFTGMISTGLSQAIGEARLDSMRDALAVEIAERDAEVAAYDAEIAGLEPGTPEWRAIDRARSTAANIGQRRSELATRIANLPAAEADVAALTEAAAAARAALPPEVAEIRRPADAPAEYRAALAELREMERDITFRSESIAATYASVGLIGLEPVQSRNFGGLLLALTIGVVAIMISLPLGIVLALGRQSDLLIVKALSVGFIEFIRGVPLITLLFVASVLLNYFLPPGTSFDIILRVIIMVTIFAAAYMAEVVRGGLAALPRGQYEAADALGLDYWKAQRLIIMPQALKISIPGIVSTFIGLFKDTTLVSIIGLIDPVGLSKSIQADANWNGILWELYGFVALLFFIFTFSMSRYSMYLERRLRTDHR